MASFDDRINKYPVARIDVPTLTVASGGHGTEATDTIGANMRVKQIAVTINDNTGNATATVELRDADGGVIWTQAGIPENATTHYQYYTLSGTDIPLNVLLQGIITVGCTASGDPGASTMTCDVALYGD